VKGIRVPNYLRVGLLLALGGSIGFLTAYLHRAAAQERSLTITARKYGYDPPVLHVNQGDRVHIRLVAKDVTHGFYLEGYNLDAKARPEDPTFWVRNPSRGTDYQAAEEMVLVASRPGSFHYRCSITCGYMHPFMNGVLVVRPNYLYATSVGLSVALAATMLLALRRPTAGGQP